MGIHRRQPGREDKITPKECQKETVVFSNREGKPLDRRNLLARDIVPACKELGLPKISWHSFRHCNATLLDSVGTPLGTVQALLGHSTPEITRSIYLHAVPEDQRRAIDNLERLVLGP
jgi:integrase